MDVHSIRSNQIIYASLAREVIPKSLERRPEETTEEGGQSPEF